MENALDYVVSLSELIKQQESRRKLALDLLFFLVAFIITVILLTYFNIEIPNIIFYIIGLILLIYLILALRWFGETLIKAFTITSFYQWSLRNFLNDWIFQGILEKNDQDDFLTLTDSDAGCILKNKTWKNFEMTFEFYVANEHGFGLIYRAKSIDNYLMFKIQSNQKVTPHYRNKDGWQILLQGISNSTIKDIENKWNTGKIQVNGKMVSLTVNDQKFTYIIPDNVIINHITNLKSALNNPLVVPMNCDEGSIGFRAHSGEKVKFKNIKIKGTP